MNGRIKKVFPGGNTSEGFFSYYRYLLEKGTRRIFVIKGGPGVGKSTLMKKVANKLTDLGYDLELHYCSSDNNSLDGIAVLSAGIVMVDGTAPHIVDPRYPGGLDEIVNLGEYWDTEKMEVNREKLIASTNEVSRLFARAYRFLKAARFMAENITAMHSQSMDFAQVNRVTLILEKLLLGHTYLPEACDYIGSERHLFSSAYTPEGYIDYSDSILQDVGRVYYLDGLMGTGKSTILSRIAERAREKGMDVEIYHTPLIPTKISTVIIKDINMAITSSPHYQQKNYEIIDLNQYMNRGILASHQEEILHDSELMENMINQGILNIRKAKEEHDVLEQYYVPNMNFAGVGEKYEQLVSRIFHLIESEVTAASSCIYN
ncbi:MAG: ATPase [Gracilibacter sp. BRH_c7a]|nr:MAG: ATPase [Gracilibacter sp. BRH_c7a]